MSNEKFGAVVILKVDEDGKEKFFLMAEPNGVIKAFENAVDACRYFEDGYQEAMSRGGSWPASAIINNLQYSPSVMQIKGVKDVERLVDIPFHCYALHSVAGIAHGIPCNEKGKKAWKTGIKPRLVS